jgi:hypothetical protein
MSHFSTDQISMKNVRLYRVKLAIFFSTLCFAVNANAQQIFEFYTGVRQNGMGNAYTAVVNDETAVLVNPAGLGKIRDSTFTLVDPEIALSDIGYSLFSSDFGNMLDNQGVLNALNAKGSNGPIHVKAQLFPSVILENFGIGIHVKYQTDGIVDDTETNYSVNYVNDWALALGYNFRLFGGVIKWGVGARLIDRTEITETLPVLTTDLNVSTYGREGLGVSGVSGIIITAPVMWLPAISAVVQDIGGTSFTLSDGLFNQVGDRRPAYVPQKLDAGVSLQPMLGKHVRMTLTGEMHDVARMQLQQDKMRLFHGGMELNFADFFFLRGGMNQSYWTAGAEFATEKFQIQAASYGEEVGTYPAKKEDRRYVFKFSLRF